jgi:hypothetical protein
VQQNPYYVDYDQILPRVASDELDSIICKLSEDLPHEWVDAYKLANRQQANILRITHDGFEYLFDHSSELVLKGEVTKDSAVEDRVVAVHGCSQPTDERRRVISCVSILRGQSTSSKLTAISPNEQFKHMIKATSLGMPWEAPLHINLFPQTTRINRGWWEHGKLYRRMESYCEKNAGTYCFSRQIHAGVSGHPQIIEFGVLKKDRKLWLAQFPNCDSTEEMATIERLFRAKIAGSDDDGLRSLL